MRQPGDGVALAAAGRVLDQIPLADAARLGIGQELVHHVELVVTGKYLLLLLPPLVVLLLHDLGVVLDDVREPGLGQNLFPQVVGFDAGLVGRVAGPVIPALVEGQKPRILGLKVRAHPHFLVVHREVHHAPAELKQQLLGLPVALVLLHRIIHGLFGQAVLELERRHRQAVDEEAQVQGELGLVLAVPQLPGDAEEVGRKAFLGLDVAGRGRAVEQVQAHRPVLDPVTQHVDDAAFGDFTLEPVEKLRPPGAVLGQVQGRGRLGLGGLQKGRELGQVHGVVPVIVLAAAGLIAGLVHQGLDDQGLQAFFAGVSRRHRSPPRRVPASSSPGISSSRPSSRSSGSTSTSTASGGGARWRTSTLPVTTSAISRVRYSRIRSISLWALLNTAIYRESWLLADMQIISSCSQFGGTDCRIVSDAVPPVTRWLGTSVCLIDSKFMKLVS